MRLLFFSICWFITHALCAQYWEQVYGGTYYDEATAIDSTADGGYVVGGVSYNAQGIGLYHVVKLDSLGVIQWERKHGASNAGPSWVEEVQTLSNGGYIVVGNYTINNNQCELFELDGQGDLVWSYKGPLGTALRMGFVVKDVSSGYLMGGYKGNFPYDQKAHLMKISSAGTLVWEMDTALGYKNEFVAGRITATGTFVLVMNYEEPTGKKRFALLEMNGAGSVLWIQNFNLAGDHTISSICNTADGGYLLAGYNEAQTVGRTDAFWMKVDSVGNFLWSNYSAFPLESGIKEANLTRDGGFCLTGYVLNPVIGNRDIAMWRLDTSGIELWNRVYINGLHEEGSAILQAKNWGYVIAGSTGSTSNGSQDAYVFRTDLSGFLYVPHYPIPERRLLRIVNLQGLEVEQSEPNKLLIYIYNDGTVEKKVWVE